MAFIGVALALPLPLRWCLARSSLTNWAARAVLDDRYSGNDRHCVDIWVVPNSSTHVLNRESGMVKAVSVKCWQNRGC